MGDIAQIGFAADTSGLDKAKASLNALVPAAAAVETASVKVERSISKVSVAATGMTAANNNTIKVISTANGNVIALTKSYEKLNEVQKRINATTGANKDQSSNIGRAADIEAYGKTLDTMRGKFDPLFAAGQAYKTKLGEINDALKVGALNETQHAKAIANTKLAFVEQVKTINGVASSHAGLSTQAMAAQHSIRSMVEGLAMGMPVTQVLTGQMNHLSYAATGTGGLKGAFGEVLGMFTKFLTGTTAIIIGILAVIAVIGYLSVSAIKGSLALDDLAKSFGLTLQQVHGLQQATAAKGIAADSFGAGMKGFSDSVEQAQHNMGTLNGLMIANGMSAKTFEGYLKNVANLVAKTTDEVKKQKLLQEAGLPSDQAWVRFMSQGADGIQKAIDESVKFNTAAETNLIEKARAFDDAWSKATTHSANAFKSFMVDALSWVDQLQSKTITAAGVIGAALAIAFAPVSIVAAGVAAIVAAAALAAKIAGYGQNEPAPTTKLTVGTVEKAAGKKTPEPKTLAEMVAANQQEQQRLSLLGELASVEEKVRQKQLELNAAGLNGISVSKAQSAALINITRATAEQNDVNSKAAVGVFNLSEAQKAATDTLQMWIDKGLINKNNTEQMAGAQLILARNIKATSDAAKIAAAPLQGLKQLELDASNFSKQLDGAVTGSLNNLVTPIQDTLNGVNSLSDGFKNGAVVILKAIQEMIIKMLILAPIAKALQGVLGGWMGGAGAIAGAIGPTSLGGAPLIPNANGNAFNGGIQPFAKGGAFTNAIIGERTLFSYANGKAFGEMGEAGPEAVMPLKRGSNGALGVQMYGQNGNDNGATNVSYSPQYTLGGNVTQEDLANVKKAQEQDRKQFASRVAATIPELRRRNVRV